MLSARGSRRRRDGARRGPRLAQGAEKTRQLSCFIEGMYQGTTSRKRTGQRADLTVPRPRAARTVQIDFRRGAVKPVKRGAFPRVHIGELESLPRAKLVRICGLGASRRATARGAVRGSHRAPKKPFPWGALSGTYTKAQHLNSICILGTFGGLRGANNTPRCISSGSSRPPVSNGVEVVPLHVYLRKQCLDRTLIGVLYETCFAADLSTSKTHTNGHRKLQ